MGTKLEPLADPRLNVVKQCVKPEFARPSYVFDRFWRVCDKPNWVSKHDFGTSGCNALGEKLHDTLGSGSGAASSHLHTPGGGLGEGVREPF